MWRATSSTVLGKHYGFAVVILLAPLCSHPIDTMSLVLLLDVQKVVFIHELFFA